MWSAPLVKLRYQRDKRCRNAGFGTGRDGAATSARPVSPESAMLLRDLALDRIRQGVCVFDGQQRLLLSNRRYAEIYGLRPSEVRAGMTLRDIVDLRYVAGTGPAMPPEHYTSWRDRIGVADKVVDTQVTLWDGRVLAIHHAPLPGGGWVSTHEDITERSRAEEHVRHMAHHDALTGLPNRILFTERLGRTLRRLGGDALEDHRPAPAGTDWHIAVCFLDLDHFKDINDTLGHAAGDELLRIVAERIRPHIGQDDMLARLGGDEFAILLDQAGSEADAAARAMAVIGAIAAPMQLGTVQARVGASIGIALRCAQEAVAEPALLLRQADMALYRAKTEGRNTVRFFDAGMASLLHRRTQMKADLEGALADGGLSLHFQPLVLLASGMCGGAEALARWTHPEHGAVPPSEFIPLAEHTGLIGRLGAWVLRAACEQAAGWNGIVLAVNLSPEQVRQPGLVDLVTATLAETGLPPERLELEITETVLLHDTEATLETLGGLRRLGVGIVLDDFGMGYSSLGYLSQFPFTKLKIDKSFIARIGTEPRSAAIIRAVVTLGQSLAIGVTAEGIETPAQLAFVHSVGCDQAQGYLLGRPCPAEAFEQRWAMTARRPDGLLDAPRPAAALRALPPSRTPAAPPGPPP